MTDEDFVNQPRYWPTDKTDKSEVDSDFEEDPDNDYNELAKIVATGPEIEISADNLDSEGEPFVRERI